MDIKSRRGVLRVSDRKEGKSEGVTWIVKAAGLRFFCLKTKYNNNLEFEECPQNLDF